MSGHGDDGLTLVETLVTVVLASILMAIGTWAMHRYVVANRESGTAQQIRSALRNVQEQAVSEGRTYCVYFTATAWTVYRSDCTVAANKASGPFAVSDKSITLTAITFPAPSPPIANQASACPAAGRCAYMYPRGTALAGSLQVTRPGKSYRVSVEGLTGRVSLA